MLTGSKIIDQHSDMQPGVPLYPMTVPVKRESADCIYPWHRDNAQRNDSEEVGLMVKAPRLVAV